MAGPPARAHGKWVDQGNGSWVRYGLRNNEIDTSLRFETWHEPKQEEKRGPGIFGIAAQMAQEREAAKNSEESNAAKKEDKKGAGFFGWDPNKPQEQWNPTKPNKKVAPNSNSPFSTSQPGSVINPPPLRLGKLGSIYTSTTSQQSIVKTAPLNAHQQKVFAPVDMSKPPEGLTQEQARKWGYGRLPNDQSLKDAAKRLSDPNLDPKIKGIIDHYAPSAKTAEQKVLAVQQNPQLRQKLAGYLLDKAETIKDQLPDRVGDNKAYKLLGTGYQDMRPREYASLLSISKLDGTFKEDQAVYDPISSSKRGKVVAGQHRAASEELLQRVGIAGPSEAELKSRLAATADTQQKIIDDMKSGKISQKEGSKKLVSLDKRLKADLDHLNAVREDWGVGDWEGDFKKPQPKPKPSQVASVIPDDINPATSKTAITESLASKLRAAGVSAKDLVLTSKAGTVLSKSAPVIGKVIKVAGPVGVIAGTVAEIAPVWGGRTYNEPITLPDGSRIVQKDGKWVDLPKSTGTIAGGYALQAIDKKTGKLIYQGKNGSLKIIDLNAKSSKEMTKTISASELKSQKPAGADTFFYDKDGKKNIAQLTFQTNGKVKLKGSGGAQTYRTFDSREEADAWLSTHQAGGESNSGVKKTPSTKSSGGGIGSFAKKAVVMAAASEVNTDFAKQRQSAFQNGTLKPKPAQAIGGGVVGRAEREGPSIAPRKIGLGGAANVKPTTSATAAIVGSGINGPAGRPYAVGSIPATQRQAGPGGPGGAGGLPADPPAQPTQHQDTGPHQVSGASTYFYSDGKKQIAQLAYMSNGETWLKGPGGQETYQKFKSRDAAQEWLLTHQKPLTKQGDAGPVVVAGSPPSSTEPTKSPPQGQGWKPDGKGGFSTPLFYQGVQKGTQVWINGEIDTKGFGTWNDTVAQAGQGIPPVTGLADAAAEIAAKKRAAAVARATAEKRQQEEEARQRAAALAAA